MDFYNVGWYGDVNFAAENAGKISMKWYYITYTVLRFELAEFWLLYSFFSLLIELVVLTEYI